MPEEDARVVVDAEGYWSVMNGMKEGPFTSLVIAREKLGQMLTEGRERDSTP